MTTRETRHVAVDIFIILNNYFHDVATATLLSSAVIMWILGKHAEEGGAAELAALGGAYPTLTKFAWGALAWIIIGGVPRTIFFNTHEFIPAEVNGLLVALAIKHVLMVVAVTAGIVMWIRVKRMIAEAPKEMV